MNFHPLFGQSNYPRVILGTAVLIILTGCVGYIGEPSRREVYVAPPVMEPEILVQDDYVFYPSYGVYYSSNRHQYFYQDRGAWISRPAPRGVSVNVLLRSPSVRMDFHDSPANHHAAMVQRYPKNWAPPGRGRGQDDNRQDDKRGDRGGGRGR